MTVKEQAKEHGINYNTVISRLRHGKTLTEALTEPVKVNRRHGRYTYYIVTADDYEYTLDICNSIDECAAFLGCTPSNISHAATHNRVIHGRYRIIREEIC